MVHCGWLPSTKNQGRHADWRAQTGSTGGAASASRGVRWADNTHTIRVVLVLERLQRTILRCISTCAGRVYHLAGQAILRDFVTTLVHKSWPAELWVPVITPDLAPRRTCSPNNRLWIFGRQLRDLR